MARNHAQARVRNLRPSMVSVVAAFSALGGCIDGGPHVFQNPPACTDASAAGCVPFVCDEAAPEEGSPCAHEGESCGYDYCGDIPTREATCRDGRWEILISSCNPPPPPTDVCPSEVPVDATPCAVSEDELCHYGDCGGFPTLQAVCMDGLWSVIESTCNPPPPDLECPSEAPVAGDPCALPPEPLCVYYDGCETSTIEAECTPDGWVIMEVPCNPPPPDLTE